MWNPWYPVRCVLTSFLCVNRNTFSLWVKVKCSWNSCKLLIILNHTVFYIVWKIIFFFFLVHLSFSPFSFDWHCRNIPEHMFVLMTRESLYRKFFEHSKYRWQDFKLLDHLTSQRFEGNWPYTEGEKKKVKGNWVRLRIMLIYFKNPFSFTSQSFVYDTWSHLFHLLHRKDSNRSVSWTVFTALLCWLSRVYFIIVTIQNNIFLNFV